MKKTIITLQVVFAGLSVLAQGTVNFGNVGTGTAVSNSLTMAATPAGTTFRASLYFLPDQATVPTTDEFTARGTILNPSVNSFALAGQFIGGTRTTPGVANGGIAPGAFGYFQVRAWEAAFGATYAEAANNPNPIGGRLALVGTAIPVRVQTGDGALVGPGSLVTAGLKGFYVSPVPEPSLLGLGALGIGALLLLRRRK